MAHDIFTGHTDNRDWSCGAAEASPSAIEVWKPPQIAAFGELVNREVDHNTALVKKRAPTGSLDKNEAVEFAKFSQAWQQWRTKEMGHGKPLTGATADKLKEWRGRNAGWTAKLSETARPGQIGRASCRERV